ncbi:RagB/SusD family nutrient uptake outer membrane protein [Paradesertivirga mongoliensis]|uniref:RagB/SusD family nutrient uptake outer membrane protein n=1 Tax=Paradesertivirga mongoliensis TaxID=2100740 RepID=A0ABW4ZKV6_9SPHI|nr:RagB/SusD family nutrient uptake outer membrane protein [Pedobacter mongoliensis]
MLDKRPDSSLTRQDFFKTEDDANAALIGIYDALQSCVGKFWMWGESRGDLISAGASGNNTYPYFQLFEPNRFDSNQRNINILDWQSAYLLIGRANVVITDVPGITKKDNNFTEQESNSIVGQARFMRALAYYYLVRSFNEIPLVTVAPNSDAVDYRPFKTSPENILKSIEEDLAFAEQHVPVQYALAKDTRGLVTKGAVNALQADVYLWEAKYDLSAAASKKVLDNQSLYNLVPGEDWLTIFSLKNTNESIFEVQFDYTKLETNDLRGVSGAYLVNNALIGDFTNEFDVIRGKDVTYFTGGMFWKYTGLSKTTDLRRPTNDPNFIIYRLPDVMLMRAEALANGTFEQKEEAIGLINEVRARAGIGLYEVSGGYSTETLVDYILKERAMELAMEGKRWFDLLRVARNYNRPQMLVDLILRSRTPGERSLIRSRIIDPRSWFLPINQEELNANPNLVQNPFYK